MQALAAMWLCNVAKMEMVFWQQFSASCTPGDPAEAINPINCCWLQYLDSRLPPQMSCVCSEDVLRPGRG